MAFIGLPFFGFCKVTVVKADDGTETETFGKGKMTGSAISFKAANSSKSKELWAGDNVEQYRTGAPRANVTMERSYLSLQDEADLCGHTVGTGGEMVYAKDPAPGYFVVATMAKAVTPEKKLVYRVTAYHRVQFDPIDDEGKTETDTPNYITQTLTGVASVNADGKFKTVQEFSASEYAAALSKMKSLLHITSV